MKKRYVSYKEIVIHILKQNSQKTGGML